MPAQWPIFINNLSKKLASRTSKGPDDMGMFVANEYYNAVKTAQTPFGNIHKSGQKSILEDGFKKAFNMLFESLEPKLEDKFGNPIYDDMFERLPGVDLSSNPDCEFEEWTINNKETIEPFQFYPLFPTTCIIPKPIVPETNLFGEIVITSENVDNQPELRYVTMSVVGGDGTSPYEFTYSLNGQIQPVLSSDSTGVARFLAPTDPGKYEYTFISAIDSSKREEIKDINRTASIEIKEDSNAVEIKVDPPQVHQLVKPMTETEQIDEIANRIYYQNDGTINYLDWIKRLPYHGTFARKVSKKVLELLDKDIKSIQKNTNTTGTAKSQPNNIEFNYNERRQAAYEVFKKALEKFNELKNQKEDSIETKYANIELLQANISRETVELINNQKKAYTSSASQNIRNIANLNNQIEREFNLIDSEIAKKNINELQNIDSIDYITSKVRTYQNRLIVSKFNQNEDEVDVLNRELTTQTLQILKLKNKIKKETLINDRIFQEEYNDRPDSIPEYIKAKFICIFTYVESIDGNQKGAPSKNILISNTTPSSSYGYASNSNGNSKAETYDEWSKRTEPSRLKAKLSKYELEKVRYRELKIQYVNQVAEDNKKAGNACGAGDAYCVMSKCILDYWKSTGSQPFATSPPILPCLIPSPGSYVPIYYGDEAKLGADLRRAWNTGKRFKLEPNLQTATRAVATAMAVSCARHLKDLKFIYNGKIPAGSGTAPMIGFSPIAF